MREIKFRSWDNTRNEYLSAGKVFIPVYPSKAPKSNTALNLDTSNFLAADGRMVLEQFTGLQDANGVDIYEGDVVNHRMGYFWTVIFEDEESRFALKCKPPLIRSLDSGRAENCEVIGNIHQNPELITKG